MKAGFGGFIVRRLVLLVVSTFAVVSIAFALVLLTPGDPAIAIAGESASQQQVAEVRAKLGLSDPVPTRYVRYVTDLVHGDLGTSFFTGRSVAEDIARYLPNTLELMALSLSIAVVVGLLLGVVAAYFYRGRIDTVATTAITATQSIPDFVLGLVLVFVVFFLLRWAPAPIGRLGLTDPKPTSYTGFLIVDSLIGLNFPALGSALAHAMLPALTLGVVYSAFFGKVTRAVMAKALGSATIEFARACGLPERQVIRYALLTARAPILTYGAILFGVLIGGEAIIETLFGWQGIGQWALEGVGRVDLPVIRGFILVNSFLTLMVYLVLDIVVTMLDPRISYG